MASTKVEPCSVVLTKLTPGEIEELRVNLRQRGNGGGVGAQSVSSSSGRVVPKPRVEKPRGYSQWGRNGAGKPMDLLLKTRTPPRSTSTSKTRKRIPKQLRAKSRKVVGTRREWDPMSTDPAWISEGFASDSTEVVPRSVMMDESHPRAPESCLPVSSVSSLSNNSGSTELVSPRRSNERGSTSSIETLDVSPASTGSIVLGPSSAMPTWLDNDPIPLAQAVPGQSTTPVSSAYENNEVGVNQEDPPPHLNVPLYEVIEQEFIKMMKELMETGLGDHCGNSIPFQDNCPEFFSLHSLDRDGKDKAEDMLQLLVENLSSLELHALLVDLNGPAASGQEVSAPEVSAPSPPHILFKVEVPPIQFTDPYEADDGILIIDIGSDDELPDP